MTEESRKRISERAKERYADKTKNPMYGKKHTETTLQKMSICKQGNLNPMYGSKWTDVQRKRSGTKGKKLNLSIEHRKRLSENAYRLGKETGLKPVFCIEDAVEFPSVTEAANAYGVSKSTLNGHLKGRQKTCAGKHFTYINN